MPGTLFARKDRDTLIEQSGSGYSKVGSAIRKTNFYKSIPLSLWDVHCSIPLLDPP